MVKRFVYFTLSLLMAVTVPLGTLQAKVKASVSTHLSSHLQNNSKPLKEKSRSQDFLNPSDYPLVNSGQLAGTLVDSHRSSHRIYYNSTTNYSTDVMDIQLGYQSSSSTKDPYLNIEFFTNNNGVMNYLGDAPFNLQSYTSANLDMGVSKDLYKNDPYIYMRVGVLANITDSYYSDVIYFKVSNPYYQPPATGSAYELISNESTNYWQGEDSGSFKINNSKYAFSKKLGKKAYQLDYNKPFTVPTDKSKRINKNTSRITENDKLNDFKSFWVTNIATNEDYQLSAQLLYSGTHSNVWVYDNQITSDDAAKLGKEFDNKIHPSDTSNFGTESDVDQNGKVNILCYDIQDGFNGSGGYVAGYFYAGDLYNIQHSNKSEIFYIDTYPLMGMSSTKDVTAAYSTLAHEFQHMINFNQNVLVEGHSSMDTWMNEGLSMAAEQIYLGTALQDRIDYYNEDYDIANGHSLLYWDDSGDVLANYSLSYLFFQYLKIQCNAGNQVFKEIINDPNSDEQSIQDVIHKYINPKMTFGQFMTDFRAALFLKANSGLYGFKGDASFKTLEPRLYYGPPTTLLGGGAVIKQIPSPSDFKVPADKGEDVTYTLLAESDLTPPAAPKVNSVGDNSTSVTGTAEANATITVKAGSKVLGSKKADGTGKFSVPIAKQKAGTKLTVYAVDAAHNTSSGASVTVVDRTAPAAPKVNTVGDNSTSVTGTAEANATITVKAGSKVLGSKKADGTGKFSVPIAKQKAGTKLTVYAMDAAHNTSSGTSVTVVDRTAPAAPKVNTVGDNSTSVTGTAEANATITVKAGSKVLGSKKADGKGNISVPIAKQKAGTKLTVYAVDAAHNTSSGASVTVVDRTAPARPSFNTLGDNQTTLTGKAEAGAAVIVSYGKTVVGQAYASSKGTFSIILKSKQKAGVTLTAYARDKAGNKSASVSIKVVDKTPPDTPTVNTVTSKSTSVTGKEEEGATVYVYAGKTYLGKATVSSKGTYSVQIKKQKKGTVLSVYAKDKAGNKSKTSSIKVK